MLISAAMIRLRFRRADADDYYRHFADILFRHAAFALPLLLPCRYFRLFR